MENELEEAWGKAWSRYPQNPDSSELRHIGSITKGPREYIFYKDKEGNYWYDSKQKGDKKH